MRWKTFFSHNPKNDQKLNPDTYNLKSQKTPTCDKLLEPFEGDLINLIRKVKFKNYSNCFQAKIGRDIKNIKNSNKLWIKADKSKNFYKIKPSEYDKLVTDKITSFYKKDKDNNTLSSINEDICKFANKFGVADRMGKFNVKDAYILFKDHKPNFANNLQSSLINPSKSELCPK